MEKEPKSNERFQVSQPELEKRPEVTASPETAKESEAQRAHNVEQARAKVEKQASHEQREAPKEGGPKRFMSAADRKQAYVETMASLQRHLPTFSRGFSKVIHNPAVEKTSEVVGKTVMRPSVTLGATSTALLVGVFTFWLAKHYGYSISPSLVLFSLLVGAVVGLLLEGISKLFRRKN